MAQFRLNAYDADLFIPQFLGLKQDEVGLNPDMRFAAECYNVETIDGVLQSRPETYLMDQPFENRVETLMRFHRRYYQGEGTADFLVCASGGKLYQKQESANTWEEIQMPSGVTSFESNVWSWVTYEMNVEGTDYPVDILVISNAYDGMYIVVPSDLHKTWGMVKKQTWADLKNSTWQQTYDPQWVVFPVDTKGNKFSVIERHDERIWGGGILGDDDKLVYSAVYDPMDWRSYPYPDPDDPTKTIGEPEDGAGDILLPSWDGDAFTTLKSFGENLIAFKKRRAWRIIGTNPGEYDIKEQYGGGAPYPNTVAVYGERIFMADRDGLSYYDGMNVSPFMREYVQELWKKVNKNRLDQMFAVIFKDKYYLAFPEVNNETNTGLLIYDLRHGTILYYTHEIECMLATDEHLYATTSSLPGWLMDIHYNSWDDKRAAGTASRWVSPWLDFGRKDIQKGGFDLYFIPEVQDEAVTLRFSVQTEKKIKTKQYTVQPLTEAQKEIDRQHRGKRLHFGGNGRRFRLIIETDEGSHAPWRLIGGLHLIVETDPD